MKSNIDAKKKIVLLAYCTVLNRELLCKYMMMCINITFNCLDAISKLITSGDKARIMKLKSNSTPSQPTNYKTS